MALFATHRRWVNLCVSPPEADRSAGLVVPAAIKAGRLIP